MAKGMKPTCKECQYCRQGGRWISWEKAGNFVPSPDRHECSVCHDAAQVLVNEFELLSDYCPNCGAKMDGGDNTER